MKQNNSHYFIIAGEASGDLHGAELISHLKKIDSNSVFSGIGGQKMQHTGLNSLVPLEKLAVMGFWEVLKKYRFFLNLETSLYEKNLLITFNFIFFEKFATFLDGSNPVQSMPFFLKLTSIVPSLEPISIHLEFFLIYFFVNIQLKYSLKCLVI